MKELYRKYLEAYFITSYDNFKKIIESLPIDNLEEIKNKISFFNGSKEAIYDIIDAIIEEDWITIEDVEFDEKTIDFSVSSYDVTPESINKLRNLIDKFEAKGWTIIDKEKFFEDLDESIKDYKKNVYKEEVWKFFCNMNGKEIEDFYNRFIK